MKIKEQLELYRQAPIINHDALPSFYSLQGHIENGYRILTSVGIKVEIVDYDPYSTAQEMFNDIQGGKLLVSALHNYHPVFTPDLNLKSRAFHDYCHYLCKGDFSLAGEIHTFDTQARFCSAQSRAALYTEVVLQAAHKVYYNEFPQQKVFVIPAYN